MNKEISYLHRDDFERATSFTIRDWIAFLVGALAFSTMCGLIDYVNMKLDKMEKTKNTQATLVKVENQNNEICLSFDTDNNPETVEYIGYMPSDSGKDLISIVGKKDSFKGWQRSLKELRLSEREYE